MWVSVVASMISPRLGVNTRAPIFCWQCSAMCAVLAADPRTTMTRRGRNCERILSNDSPSERPSKSMN
uniref:Putative secreted protein n=1 Tax=Anopheles darlingi TaxID=43151 RepID=A0A2M4DL48_ANODA